MLKRARSPRRERRGLPADPEDHRGAEGLTDATLAYIRAPIGEAKGRSTPIWRCSGDTAALRLVAEAQLGYAQKLVKGTSYEGLPLFPAVAPFRSAAVRVRTITPT